MKTCRRRHCHAPADCCGAAVTVQLWPHAVPLPDGAVPHEGPEVTDHHRYFTTVVELRA